MYQELTRLRQIDQYTDREPGLESRVMRERPYAAKQGQDTDHARGELITPA
jgi:hypothetical protein